MEVQEAAASTARKGDRISISISVRVSCIDLAGGHFTDVVQTVNVSRSGCCLPLKCSLAPGQKIHLQRIGSGEEAVGRVVGQTGVRSEHNLYGIEVLNQSDNFWGIRFLDNGVVGFLYKRNWKKVTHVHFSNALCAKPVT
jgi:hypothetical protein